jgi:polyhydroxyalkanoate synthesis regulator protein
LPVGFLRQLIALYGGSMQSMVPEFLENSLDNFRKNQQQVQNVIETAITSGPFGDITKQNIEFVRAARDALLPSLAPKKSEKPKAASVDNEVADLKQQLADLQAKIDRMSAGK